MSSNEQVAASTSQSPTGGPDRPDGPAGYGGHAGRETAGGSQTPRLVVSWLIVGVPLGYGIYQTVSKTLPLFGG